jgi:hypothetical protein
MYSRPYIVRKATTQGGKEVTVPPFSQLEPGDKVVVLCNGFMLVLPEGATVNEKLLKQAIGMPKESR